MFVTITDADFEAVIAQTEGGVLLFHKKLCPHCKNMEKVLEKFHAATPGTRLLLCDIEENATAAATLGAERPPTLLIIHEGRVTGRKAGLMNPKELQALYRGA